MKPRFNSRAFSASFFLTLACGGLLDAADVLYWDVNAPPAAITDVVGSATPVPVAPGVSGTVISGGGSGGNNGSPSNTWNRSYGSFTSAADATSAGDFISFETTVNANFTTTFDGVRGLQLSRTSVGPKTAGLFYSTDGGTTFTQTGSDFTVGQSAASAATAFSSGLSANPLVIAGPATVQWRIVVWNGSGNRLGITNSATNDFALTGTSTSASTKNLRWAGADGATWNTALVNWQDLGNGNAATAFSTADNATISTAGGIEVTAAGVSPGSLKVDSDTGTTTLSGGPINALSLNKSGAGTLVLNNSNSFTGGSILIGGVTELGIADALGTQPVSLRGATLRVNPAVAEIINPLSLGEGGAVIENEGALKVGAVANFISNNTLTKNGAGDLNLSDGLGTTTSGAVSLTVSTGTLTVTGNKDTNLGDLVVLNGNLNLAGGVIVPHKSTINGTGMIVFKDAASSITPRFNFGSVRVDSPILLEADGTVNSANGNNQLDLYGVISGPFNFVKNGNGTATFRVDNTYTGTTMINGNGTLRLSGTGNLGEGDVTITEVGGSLSFEISGPITVANQISGAGRIFVSPTSIATGILTNSNTYTGATFINGSTSSANGITQLGNGGISAAILADGGLPSSIGQSSSDSDSLILNGGALVYSGATNGSTDRNFTLGIDGGRLSTSGAGAVSFTSTNPITVAEPTPTVVGTMNVNNLYKIVSLGDTDWVSLGAPANFSVGTIFQPNAVGAGTGQVVFANSRPFVLDGGATGTSVLSLALSDPSNAPARLIKQGTGTWSIAGTSNSFTGQTLINNGVLRFDSLNPNVTGAVAVNSGGSLGGNGSANAPVTLGAGGGLSVKISDWNGAAGTGYDDLEIASLDGSSVATTLRINGLGITNFTESEKSFTILNTTSGITNYDLNAIAFSSTNFPGNGTWTLSQSGNSLVLNYAPGVADPFKAYVTGPPYNLSGDDAKPTADPDFDGIPNVIEFILGGNPTSGADSAVLPTVASNETNFVFTYRVADAAAYLNPVVEYGPDLTPMSWTTAANGQDGVAIGAPTDLGGGVKQIAVTIPKDAKTKLFARLKVLVP